MLWIGGVFKFLTACCAVFLLLWRCSLSCFLLHFVQFSWAAFFVVLASEALLLKDFSFAFAWL